MIFESKVLKNYKVSGNYCDGEFNFDFLPKMIDIQYAITNTVENKIIGEEKTNRAEKFTELENIFIRLVNFLNENEFESYKKIIHQKLDNESLINWNAKRRETERKNLSEKIHLDYIVIEWRKDFWDIENDEIIYNEKYEIVMRFIDEKYIDECEIVIGIEPTDFKIKSACFEEL